MTEPDSHEETHQHRLDAMLDHILDIRAALTVVVEMVVELREAVVILPKQLLTPEWVEGELVTIQMLASLVLSQSSLSTEGAADAILA